VTGDTTPGPDRTRPPRPPRAACRTLAVAARRCRERRGQVLLVAPQSAVPQTLRLPGLDQLPGLQVVGGDA
jgi:hypothetical protein